MVEDRTRCHADHVGQGPDRMTTAAVGVLKSIKVPDEYVKMFVTLPCISYFMTDLVVVYGFDRHQSLLLWSLLIL